MGYVDRNLKEQKLKGMVKDLQLTIKYLEACSKSSALYIKYNNKAKEDSKSIRELASELGIIKEAS